MASGEETTSGGSGGALPAAETSVSTTTTPTPIKMEVGIEDCLHIEFEYDKACNHLSDVVLGRISFLLVRIRLKHMELEVRRRETSGSGSNARSEATTLCKYEIMDGAPVRGETVPIRLCLAPYDLTPTYLNVHNKVTAILEFFVVLSRFFFVFRVFCSLSPSLSSRPPEKKKIKISKNHQFSARYFLNLVLVDEEDRRYFKQQEITLWRKRGADERACGGGAGCGIGGGGGGGCGGGGGGGSSAVAAAAPTVSPATPGAAAAAAAPTVSPATPGAAAAAAASVPAATTASQQQPTEQLQREEEEEAAPVVVEAAAATEGKEEKREEEEATAATATTTTQEQQTPPATPPAA